MVDSQQDHILELFNNRLETCTSNRAFMDYFYQLFVNASPEVAEKFSHTNFARQKQVLKLSLYMLLMAAQGLPEGDAHLERIAKRHNHSGLDIRPELYAIWLNCLLQAAKKFDPDYNEEVEQAWRYVLQKGIDFMIAQY